MNQLNHTSERQNSLICFYKNQFIQSTSYSVLEQKKDQSLKDFLASIEEKFLDQIKILQIPFESGFENLFAGQKPLYAEKKARVYILQTHQLLKKLDADSLLNSQIHALNSPLNLKFQLLTEKNKFIEQVKWIRSEIAKGRLYQVNLTAPLVAEGANLSPDQSEHLLYSLQPLFKGTYSALLPAISASDRTLISLSPELFLRREGRYIVTQPIKGSTHNNLKETENLLKSSKEQAELSMIVDLLRNDLNCVEDSFSAEVIKHRDLMKLNYIEHTYSEIRLQTEKNLSSILPLMLPAGSISGCPKIESLQLIAEIETYKRQAYTGLLGWWEGSDFELNVTIRSFINAESNLFYHAGCGIVFDSDPEHEWQELIAKTGRLQVIHDN